MTAPAAVVGVTIVVSSTANAIRIVTTPMQMSSNGSGGNYSKEDIDKMKQGKAPTGDDGHPKELHHENQKPNGRLQEMTRTDHRGRGNYTTNHPNGNKSPSQIDRQKFRAERERYWKDKAKKLEQK